MDETIELGGKKFVISPPSARRCIKFAKIVSALGAINPGAMSEEQMISVYEALLIGLQQAAPELTLDQLLDMPITMPAAIDAVKTFAKLTGIGPSDNPQEPAAKVESASLMPPASSGNGIASSPI